MKSTGSINEALLESAKSGSATKVAGLLAQGADPDWLNKQKRTALIEASERGHTRVVRKLLAAGATVNLRGKHRDTALSFAAIFGHHECVALLLKAGADPNTRKSANGLPVTVLTLAAGVGHLKVVDLLLRAGASVSEVATNRYPMEMAASSGMVACMRRLVKAGADPNFYDKEIERTALISAAKHGELKAVQFLLTQGAKINHQDYSGMTALMWAAAKGRLSVVQELIKCGAVLNLRGEASCCRNHTALVFAIINQHEQEALALIRAGTEMTPADEQRVKKFFGGKIPR